MTLETLTWDDLRVFILNDLKMSDKPTAVQANKSRFIKLKNYFENREFNRTEFANFIGWMTQNSYSPSYKNNFNKIAKIIEKYLFIKDGRPKELDDFTYFYESKEFVGEILTPEEVNQIINVDIKYGKYKDLLNQRNKLLLTFLWLTGCRIGEAIDLKVSDVHCTPDYVIFRDTKNGDNRKMVIPKELRESLLSIPRTGDSVFAAAKSGKKLGVQEINLDIKKRAKACGINKRVYNHLFRHSFITIMLMNGADSLDVAKMVGHKDTRTTMRYAHQTLDHYSEVMQLHPLIRSQMTPQQARDRIIKKLHNEGTLISENLDGDKLTLTISLLNIQLQSAQQSISPHP